MSSSTPSNDDLIDAVEEVLTATLELARTLTPEQGELPTGCPGWSVQNKLARTWVRSVYSTVAWAGAL